MENIIELLGEKVSKRDLIDVIKMQAVEIADLETANQSWRDEQAKNKESLEQLGEQLILTNKESSKRQKRVAALFGKIERIARILNQTDDRSDITDVKILEEIVEVVEEEIEKASGVFINHKGEEL